MSFYNALYLAMASGAFVLFAITLAAVTELEKRHRSRTGRD